MDCHKQKHSTKIFTNVVPTLHNVVLLKKYVCVSISCNIVGGFAPSMFFALLIGVVIVSRRYVLALFAPVLDVALFVDT